ncbi:hypothetical protein ABB02_01664 [Clostridiaceae bacterium JG1575]|nr:hypothetical protein ABB02_01664 [Clostridiaceae bacterium JG1575]
MAMINISDSAYQEFRDLLIANDIKDTTVRIALAGFGCSGPRFGLMVDEPSESDLTEKVQDLTFVVEKELIDEYEGFIILSDEENGGGGMSLRPMKLDESASGCASCAGGCAV